MSEALSQPAAFVDPAALPWALDLRFAGVQTKALITAAQNPHASVHLIRIPASANITLHRHLQEVEVAYVVSGRCQMRVGDAQLALTTGQLICIPAGVDHAVANEGPEPVEILTIFTPPRL